MKIQLIYSVYKEPSWLFISYLEKLIENIFPVIIWPMSSTKPRSEVTQLPMKLLSVSIS